MTRQRRRPSTVFVVKLRSCRTEADNIRILRWILKRRCVAIRCAA
jgi:hypothetical protein